jgi:organic hydroperoxide reductase OsmC/OhrA
VPVRAKRFEYAIAIDRAGRLHAEGEAPIEPDPVWTADHLLLAALARCTIHSLRFHTERAGVDMVASAEANGVVTRRETDGRYAFVEIECDLDVELDTADDAEIDRLLALAERDCFVGASLTVPPLYRWRVNGSERSAAGRVEA